MRNGMRDGLMPPKILLAQVAEQTEDIAKQKAEETPFAQPINNFPKEFSDADKTRLRAEVLAAIRDQVLADLRDLCKVCARGIRAERSHRNWHLGVAAG